MKVYLDVTSDMELTLRVVGAKPFDAYLPLSTTSWYRYKASDFSIVENGDSFEALCKLYGAYAITAINSWARHLPKEVALANRILNGESEPERRAPSPLMQSYNFRTKGLRNKNRFKSIPEPTKEEPTPGIVIDFYVNGKEVPVFGIVKAAFGLEEAFELKSFTLEAEQMIAIDPCYRKLSHGVAFPAEQGVWNAAAVLGVVDGSLCNKQLQIWRPGFDVEKFENLSNFEMLDSLAGVDSARCGFFDKAKYLEVTDKAVPSDSLISADKPGVAAATHSSGFGVTSLSGYGDGAYRIYVEKNGSGQAIAATLLFVKEDEEDLDNGQ